MKHVITTLIFIVFTIETYSQVKVDGIDINHIDDIKYVQLVGTYKIFSTKVTVNVDYGQEYKWGDKQRIEGAIKPNGKPAAKVFNGMIDALNFMELNGWEYVNNTEYTISNSNVSHFLLKRREE